ncbi:MAG: family 16 glycosylhydrolase [Firmicutes bacterium]|nr:family 16 glycosylhydrolase [Bacillota bacterium]
MQRGFGCITVIATLTIFLIVVFNQTSNIYQTLSLAYAAKKVVTTTSVQNDFDFSLDSDEWFIIWHDEFHDGKFDGYKWDVQGSTALSNYSLLYGKIEIRARLTMLPEGLPGLWLVSEERPDAPAINMQHLITPAMEASLTEDFHTYAIEWSQEGIDWFLDGQEKFTTPYDGSGERLFLYVTTPPQGSEIDYVRVFKSTI